MKLNKKRLLNVVGDKLIHLGYTKFEDGFFGSDGLFIKSLPKGFYLTLGLIISRNFGSQFTGSYYLAKCVSWAAVWGDIPPNSYRRIGHFITDEEKKVVFEESDKGAGIHDAWWNAFDEGSIRRFIDAVKLSESRFVHQAGLIQNIEKSVEGNILAENVSVVHKNVKKLNSRSHEFKYIPLAPIKNIPIEWFKAAELTLIDTGGILNANTVKLLAADAWFVHKIKIS